MNDNQIATLNQSIVDQHDKYERLSEGLRTARKLMKIRDREITQHEQQLSILRCELMERDRQLVERSAELRCGLMERDRQLVERSAELRCELIERDRQLVERSVELSMIYSSRSWRLTAPLRILAEDWRILRHDPRHLRAITWRPARYLFRLLPLPLSLKTRIKDFLFRTFGFLIRDTVTYRQWAIKQRSVKEPLAFDGTKMTAEPRQPESTESGTPIQKLKLDKIVFSNVVEPIVSIIVSVVNDNQLYNCLKSIREHTDEALPYEVLVADNTTTDEVWAMLQSVRGIQVIQNSKYLEFLHTLDMAAANARGRYLVFLSSDTEVRPGWLKAMHDVYQCFNQVAVVCPKLLDPNGRIREAGIIMRRDGTAYSYGEGASVDDYACNYIKEIDCTTGACLMIDQEAYIALGGFDKQFTEVGGYAAFDFAFAARENGWKVYYQPKAEIIHFSNSEVSSQIHERQFFINKWKLRAKWIDQLMEQAGSEDNYFRARDRSLHRKIILVVDYMVPRHDTNAGDFTIYLYLQLLVEMGFKVMFLPHHNRWAPQPYTEQLQQRGVEVMHDLVDFSKWMVQNGNCLNYVWLARPDIANDLIELVFAFSDAKLLYFTHDLHYLRELRRYEIEMKPEFLRESERLRELELNILKRADVILTPSDHEEGIIRELLPQKEVITIPLHFYELPTNGAKLPSFEQRENILFLGWYGHKPNVDAVTWFVREIFPSVREVLPSVKFLITGSNPPEEVKALEQPGVEVLGYVADLGALYRRIRVFVAPIRYGAGVKGKILNSLAHQVPIVTTLIGNEGINLVEGEEVLLATDPEEFARRTIELYTDQSLWERLSAGGVGYLRKHLSKNRARHLIKLATGIVVERCYVCGEQVNYVPSSTVENLRETPVCYQCAASFLNAGLAKEILDILKLEKAGSLRAVFNKLAELQIYEVGYTGPINTLLSRSRNFVCSEFFEDTPLGTIHSSGVRCENVEKLTFPTESFDLIISQDVFEHVSDPWRGFAEIHRVLKNGGHHVFTVPYSKVMAKSSTRARLIDGRLEHLKPPAYHVDPIRKEGALVFTDFGTDLPEMLERIGFQVSVRESEVAKFRGGYNAVFVTRKIGEAALG